MKVVNQRAVRAYLLRQNLQKEAIEWKRWLKENVSSGDEEVTVRPKKSLSELKAEHRKKLKALKDARLTRSQNVKSAIDTIAELFGTSSEEETLVIDDTN